MMPSSRVSNAECSERAAVSLRKFGEHFLYLIVRQNWRVRTGIESWQSGDRVIDDPCLGRRSFSWSEHDPASLDFCVERIARFDSKFVPNRLGQFDLSFSRNRGNHTKTILQRLRASQLRDTMALTPYGFGAILIL